MKANPLHLRLDADVDAFVRLTAERERITVAAWVNKQLYLLMRAAQANTAPPPKPRTPKRPRK